MYHMSFRNQCRGRIHHKSTPISSGTVVITRFNFSRAFISSHPIINFPANTPLGIAKGHRSAVVINVFTHNVLT